MVETGETSKRASFEEKINMEEQVCCVSKEILEIS